ncbi:MAG: hypothetical protein N2253_01910 [Bacteroidia bacterium]|nr:hypothetical protein [Bacteroidia bacterium]
MRWRELFWREEREGLSDRWEKWLLRGVVMVQMGIVVWDALFLMEAYGMRRAQADCVAYLGAANSLLRGEWLRMPSLFEPLPHGWMSEWPLGYPAAIALTTKLTGLEPFYASRWLNAFLYLLTYGMLAYFFPARAELILLLAIYPPNFTWNVALPLSENLFLPLLILVIAAFERYYESRRMVWLGVMLVALPFLFLARYASLAIVGAVGLWAIWRAFHRQYKEALLWGGVAAVGFGFAALYFAWNSYNHPAGESGLSLRNMPMPVGFIWLVLRDIRFLRYAALVGLLTLAAGKLSKRKPSFTLAEEERNRFLLLLFLTQAALYGWSMVKGRIGIVDTRHFVVILLPLLWYWAERLGQILSSWVLLGIGVVFLGWQIRNTHVHYQWSVEKKHLPYSYAEQVRQAYDTLPPRACIIGASLAYLIKGSRTDLCLGDRDGYLPVLLRDCPCIYVDCAMVGQRFELGIASGIMWAFVKFCDTSCKGRSICLKKVGCASSLPKSSGGSP